MPADEEIKKEFRKRASHDAHLYYPVQALEEAGFVRNSCTKCGRFFWTKTKANICGEPTCSGGFRFLGKSPAKKKLDYIQVWKEFVRIHKAQGYTPVKRYPVVARWNPTTDFTIASIAAFQPFVVSGEVAPPANPLVVPQFCLRFPDVDNVGITGHFVGFVMMGEHRFVPPKEYDINQQCREHLEWLKKGMGIPLKELTIHEDVWAGGGNLGPCIEFFSRGLEISNQVYMQYEILPNGEWKELAIKVQDMGQGQERAAWFTQGKASIYETTFPPVMKKLRNATGVEFDESFMKEFIPLTPYLNVAEVEDIEKAWQEVGKKLGMSGKELKAKVLPNAALAAVAEHSRALLVALSDGALPSNVGGMYNLRVILRRALAFIEKFGWKLSLADLFDWHAAYLKPQYPELSEELDRLRKILDVECQKYRATREKTAAMLGRIFEKELTPAKLIELYDSHGITPELLCEEAERLGKKVEIPKNFYALVAERHEKEKPAETKVEREIKLPLEGVQPTKPLYFEDYTFTRFEAKVLAVIDNYVVLDQTAFYPVAGGQMSDKGTLNGVNVIDVFKQGPHIIHVCEGKPKFHVGEIVKGEVELGRRIQLSQHHTATHIINAAARKVLGKHVNQSSARKEVDKAYLDITHYVPITEEELNEIEQEANAIVAKGLKLQLGFMPREKAEKEFGMTIYQGGAVPGKELRIVVIPGVDVEACGGTHVKNTLDVGTIKILKTSKVQDGVVRIYFVAGSAAEKIKKEEAALLAKIAEKLGVKVEEIPARAQELFEVWKAARKAAKKKTPLAKEALELKIKKPFKGNILKKTAELLQTQPEFVLKTIERFLKDLKEFKQQFEQSRKQAQ